VNDVVFVMAYSRMSVKLEKQFTIILSIFLLMNMDDHSLDLYAQTRDHLVTFEKIVVLMMRLHMIWEFLMLMKMEMLLIRRKILWLCRM